MNNPEQLEQFIVRLKKGERLDDIPCDDAELRFLFLMARKMHGAKGYDVARKESFKERLADILRATSLDAQTQALSFSENVFGRLSRLFQPRFAPVYALLLVVVIGGAITLRTLEPTEPITTPEIAQTQELSQIIADLSSTSSLASDIDLETSFADIEFDDDMEGVFVEVLELSSSLDEFDPEAIELEELDFDLTTL